MCPRFGRLLYIERMQLRLAYMTCSCAAFFGRTTSGDLEGFLRPCPRTAVWDKN